MAEVRIATFNLENFDETAADEWPSLAERIMLMRPQIARLRATIACFQEVNGQERPNQPRSLLALAELLAGTNLAGGNLASTRTTNNEVFDVRNLVVATAFPVLSVEQLRNDLVEPLSYRRLTANPPDAAAVTIGIERPILHVELDLPNGTQLHVINVHLKSKIPTDIPGQKIDRPIEHTVPAPARYTLYHQGHGEMLDHMLITRNLLAHYRGSEIHNEILHDESAAFAIDRKYPESDHAPVVATFDF
jgi:hypothetical protein